MMLASALSLAQAALVPPPVGATVGDSDPIVVIGDRLRHVRVAIGFRSGGMTCRVTRSSGYDRIDAGACTIALDCAKQERRSQRRTRACLKAGYDAFLDDYFTDGPNTNAADH